MGYSAYRMKTLTHYKHNKTGNSIFSLARSFVALGLMAMSNYSSKASQAYGTVNNFDTVNDNGVQAHGFEIELDDCHSADLSYTYDYNHYGTPKITEFTATDATGLHTNVLVDYRAFWTNSGWSAFTAVPAGPIAPTLGHQFTNPGTNFGGEHFGVGYRANPSKVLYFWMVDSGSHTLTRGGQVKVTTPVFTYTAPAPGVAAVAAAVIPAPVPIVPPAYEFSDASWVKVITTTSHTNNEVKIRDLMSVDPANPNGKDWRNGQTNVEVETEWQLLQIDYMSSDYNPSNGIGGANGKLPGANHNLGKSDDVVTYRYEYYAYVGPYDVSEPPTHEALCQMPGADGIHGTGTYSNTVVVGNFLGAQMSAMAGSPPLGLIDHLPDGQVGVAYPTRSLVIASDTNFVATTNGTLPSGLAFDAVNGRVYGTPNQAGNFLLTVTVTASNNPVLKKKYPFMVSLGPVLTPHSSVDTLAAPLTGGTTGGDGVYTNGTTATVTAIANAGYAFANWTDNGTVVSTSASYTLTNQVNRSLVANFGPKLAYGPAQPKTLTMAWLTNFNGYVLQQKSDLRSTNWTSVSNTVSVVGTNYQTTIPTTNGTRFFRLMHP